MTSVQVECSSEDYRQHEPALQLGIQSLFHRLNVKSGELTILLTDSDTVRELNRRYNEQDKTTDVLSFPNGELNPESGEIYLGDVVISVPVAVEQSQQGGHPLRGELVLLGIHGALHLLGYDHAERSERERMFELQAELLHELGYGALGPSE